MKPSARPARARRLSRPGRASPEQDRLALPAAPQGSARLTDSTHRAERPTNLTPCAGARWRFPRRRVAADTGCAPKGKPESAPRVRNPPSASHEGRRMAIRSMPAPASRSASRTDRPRRAPCRIARSEPSGGASRGRPTAGSLRRAPRTEPAAPLNLRRFPEKPVADPATEPRPYRNRTTRRTPHSLAACGPLSKRPFARERGGRLPGLRLPSSRGAGPKAMPHVGERCLLRHFRVPSSPYFAFVGALKTNIRPSRDFLVHERRGANNRHTRYPQKDSQRAGRLPPLAIRMRRSTTNGNPRPPAGVGRAGSAQASAPVDAAAGWAALTTVSVFQRPSRVFQGMD